MLTPRPAARTRRTRRAAALFAGALLLGACTSRPSHPSAPDGSAPRSPAPAATTQAIHPIARIHAGGAPCGTLIAAGYIWISNFNDATVVRIDPATNTLVGTPIRTGGQPCGMAYGDGSVWTSDYQGGSSTRIDAKTGRVLATYPTGTQPYDATFAGGAAWISNYVDNTVTRIDAASGKIRQVPTGPGPKGLAVIGGQVWVICSGDGTITRVDAATGTVAGHLTIGGSPAWTSYDDRYLWVSYPQESKVLVIDQQSGAVVATATINGGTPVDGAAAHGYAWIPDLNNGDVYRVDAQGRVTTWSSGLAGPFVLNLDTHGDAWVGADQGTDVLRFSTAMPAG